MEGHLWSALRDAEFELEIYLLVLQVEQRVVERFHVAQVLPAGLRVRGLLALDDLLDLLPDENLELLQIDENVPREQALAHALLGPDDDRVDVGRRPSLRPALIIMTG